MSWTVGDTAPAITGTLYNDNAGTRTPANLTGATLTLALKAPGALLAAWATGQVTPTTGGSFAFTPETGDLPVSGTYLVWIRVTFSDDSVQTFGPSELLVLQGPVTA